MTEAEQFMSEYLGVPESDFPVSVNLKLLGEAVEAWVNHVEKMKIDNIVNVSSVTYKNDIPNTTTA